MPDFKILLVMYATHIFHWLVRGHATNFFTFCPPFQQEKEYHLPMFSIVLLPSQRRIEQRFAVKRDGFPSKSAKSVVFTSPKVRSDVPQNVFAKYGCKIQK